MTQPEQVARERRFVDAMAGLLPVAPTSDPEPRDPLEPDTILRRKDCQTVRLEAIKVRAREDLEPDTSTERNGLIDVTSVSEVRSEASRRQSVLV